MSKNIIDKIWEEHIVMQKKGFSTIFAIDMHLMHEVTSPQAFDELRKRKLKIHDLKRNIATLDHSISTGENRKKEGTPQTKKQVQTLRKNTKKFGVKIFDFDSGHQGIIHVIAPELGVIQPGMTIACGDSHTSTHGAFGAIAFGVGTTEVGHIMATGCVLQEKPKTMKINFKGTPAPNISAKDLILKLIQKIGIGGGTGYIFEYCGDIIKKMNMEERMTICNMSIEAGARAGLISPDQITFDYLKQCPRVNKKKWSQAIKYWKKFASDTKAKYDKEVTVDISKMSPMVTWGTNPEQAIEINKKIPQSKSMTKEKTQLANSALRYTKLKPGQRVEGVPIDYVFIGSCTNGRITDLVEAAKILVGKKIARGVKMLVVPGSEAVKKEAEKMKLNKIFEHAGAEFRNPGCSMCLAMNADKVPAGKRCASTSNRNFVGRQGTGSITHLMSPAMAASSAIEGVISSKHL
ncbi:3-isopropylmalate dehydratase large subunit [Patescibacteria group bacterium]